MATSPVQTRSSGAAIYKRRRPERTVLHKIVRDNLETYLATTGRDDDFTGDVPFHAEAAFRNYLKCGILAHGFARVHCANCRHDFLVAFSCKGRDICPSCATRRMVETAAHMVDSVLPRVQFRQWVLSVPRRIRWHMGHKPEVTSELLGIFLRAVETTLRKQSPGALAGARFGAVAFVHRFGSYLNSHVHFHVLVTDGVFSSGADGEAVFSPALDLDNDDFRAVQTKMRRRGLRWMQRHGHLDPAAVDTMDSVDHAGGWSVDASVTIPDWDRRGLERPASGIRATRSLLRPPAAESGTSRPAQRRDPGLHPAQADAGRLPGPPGRPGRPCNCCTRPGTRWDSGPARAMSSTRLMTMNRRIACAGPRHVAGPCSWHGSTNVCPCCAPNAVNR